jgi:hypothetical protein
MNEDQTLVIFRRWRDSGDMIALFPEIPADNHGWYCLSYEHVGQHGAADFYGVVQATSPATLKEAAALAEELTGIGYKLKPIKRASQIAHEWRREAARAVMTVQS